MTANNSCFLIYIIILSVLPFQIFCKDASRTLHFAGTGTDAIVFGISFVGLSRVSICLNALHLKQFGTIDTAVSLLESIEKLADELITSGFPFTVLALNLPFLQAGKNH